MRFLGRKAELTTMLRSIKDLPPEQRGPVGKGGNEVKQALEALLDERTAALAGSELDEQLRADAIDVTLPGDPPRAAGHLHLITETRREIEDVFLGLGFSVAEGPEVEFDYYNFTALNHPPGHPARMLQDTFYFSDEVLLRTHTSPMQVRAMEEQRAADLHHRARQDLPARLRRDAHADVPPGRGPRDRRGHHARRPGRRAARVRASDLRRRAPDPAAAALLPVHRAERRGRHLVLQLQRHRLPEGRLALQPLQGLDAGSRSSARAWSTRTSSASSAGNGYDPERVQGFAFGMGIERIAMLRHGVPDLRLFFDNDVRFLEQFGA